MDAFRVLWGELATTIDFVSHKGHFWYSNGCSEIMGQVSCGYCRTTIAIPFRRYQLTISHVKAINSDSFIGCRYFSWGADMERGEFGYIYLLISLNIGMSIPWYIQALIMFGILLKKSCHSNEKLGIYLHTNMSWTYGSKSRYLPIMFVVPEYLYIGF